MAGTWKTQNKRRPGAYINVVGNGNPNGNSALGRVLLISDAQLGWGNKGVVELNPSSDFRAKLGVKLDDPQLAALKETLKTADTVLFLNINDGTKATGKDDSAPIEVTAKYPGEKGNNITVTIQPIPGTEAKSEGEEAAVPTIATITTLFGSAIVDQQNVAIANLNEFTGNNYIDVVPSKTVTKYGANPVTIKLTGGATKAAEVSDLMNDALENESYAVATTAGMDVTSNIHQLLVEAIKRLRENEGIKVRAVIPINSNSPAYNYEGVSTVINGYVLGDGTVVTAKDAAGYFAGLSASADEATALTYRAVSDAIEASPKLNNDDTVEALNQGEIVFTTRPGQRVVIEQDINSLTRFTDEKPKTFSKNRVIRALDAICEDTTNVFENSFLGKVSNNESGRDLFKANRVSYLQELQDNNVIQNFDPNDITVEPGNDSDAIVVNLAVTPVDAMEKLYMTIVVE